MIIWLLGISGAGKTTLGNMLKNHFDEKKIKNFLIDGDIVRNFFEGDLGFSKEERVQNIKRIMLGAHVLSESGQIAIVCNISPFEELRKFIRRKAKNYVQIFLKKSLKTSIKNDVKGVYKINKGKSQIVGIDIQFDNPEINELVIEVDKMTKEESLNLILKYLKEKKGLI